MADPVKPKAAEPAKKLEPAAPPAPPVVDLSELRGKIVVHLNAILTSDSYRQRQAHANSILHLFPE